MTKAERDELRKIVTGRERLAGRDVEQRVAELRAEAETQLAKEWAAEDAMWAAVVTEAEAAVRAANVEIQAKARTLGCPDEFLPRLVCGLGESGPEQYRNPPRGVAEGRPGRRREGDDRDEGPGRPRTAGARRAVVGGGEGVSRRDSDAADAHARDRRDSAQGVESLASKRSDDD